MGKRSNRKGFYQLMAETTATNYPDKSKAILQKVENPVYCGFVTFSEPQERVAWVAVDSLNMFGAMTGEIIGTSADGQKVSIRVLLAEAGKSSGDFFTLPNIPLEELEDCLIEETKKFFEWFNDGYIPLAQNCVYVPVIQKQAANQISFNNTCNLSPLKEFVKQKQEKLNTNE